MEQAALQACVLGSGSKGNCTYIESPETRILLDAGLSAREIERRLRSIDRSPETLDGVLISHEHSDHIQGVGALVRRYNIPLYINPATWRKAQHVIGVIRDVREFATGTPFPLKDLRIEPFSLPHDAEDPVAFRLSWRHRIAAVVTDLGYPSQLVRERLKGCHLLILEANHDDAMLKAGPYPWPLKQRIGGKSGHLSNEQSCQLLREVLHDELEHVVLAHLSEINNFPDLARLTLQEALGERTTRLSVASQREVSPWFVLAY
ncbi:MAG: MBL fold metallo-hydrolase [Candidatus Entotheonellia bacterium]